MTEITQHPQRLGVADIEVVNESALLLLETLAGFELPGGGIGRFRVGRELGLRDTQRVHRVRPLDEVGDEGQVVRVIERVAHLAVERVAFGTAVRAKAVDGEVRVVDVVGQRAFGAGEVGPGAEGAETSIHHTRAQLRRPITVRGENLDDAAGGIPIQRGERSAQNLDPAGGVEVELRDLPLAVRPVAGMPSW